MQQNEVPQDAGQCDQWANFVSNEHQEECPDISPRCGTAGAPPQMRELGLISENQDQCIQSPSSLPDYPESPETTVEKEGDSSGSDIPFEQEKESRRDPPVKRGRRKRACDECRRKRVRCLHRVEGGEKQVSNSGKRRGAVDQGSPRKKRILRITTAREHDTHESKSRKGGRKSGRKGKLATSGTIRDPSTNPCQDGYMLPTYVNYREKMDAHLTTFTEKMNGAFFSLQDTVASMQATMSKAQQAYETLEEYRDTLEKWAEGCMRER